MRFVGVPAVGGGGDVLCELAFVDVITSDKSTGGSPPPAWGFLVGADTRLVRCVRRRTRRGCVRSLEVSPVQENIIHTLSFIRPMWTAQRGI